MKRQLRLVPFAASALVTASHPALAQDSVQVPLFDGALVLSARAGVTEATQNAGNVSLTFWRPITLGRPDRPIGGRMDCQLAGVEQPFSDAAFDVEARYTASIPRRKQARLKDESVTADGTADIRHVEVTGSASNPHRHYVLTFLALRDAGRLLDLRMNCEFKHLQDPGETDYAAIMHQYVDIAVPGLGAPNTQPSDQ